METIKDQEQNPEELLTLTLTALIFLVCVA